MVIRVDSTPSPGGKGLDGHNFGLEGDRENTSVETTASGIIWI